MILREIAGKTVKSGEIVLLPFQATGLEGVMIAETAEIRAGDIALICYSRPSCDGLLLRKN